MSSEELYDLMMDCMSESEYLGYYPGAVDSHDKDKKETKPEIDWEDDLPF